MTRDLIDALFVHAEEMRRAWNKKGEDLGAPDPWEEIETAARLIVARDKEQNPKRQEAA